MRLKREDVQKREARVLEIFQNHPNITVEEANIKLVAMAGPNEPKCTMSLPRMIELQTLSKGFLEKEDFVEALIEARTKINPEFPTILAEAEEQRKEPDFDSSFSFANYKPAVDAHHFDEHNNDPKHQQGVLEYLQKHDMRRLPWMSNVFAGKLVMQNVASQDRRARHEMGEISIMLLNSMGYSNRIINELADLPWNCTEEEVLKKYQDIAKEYNNA